MTPPLDLQAIRARADAASPGRWYWLPLTFMPEKEGHPQREADLAFALAARSDVPALCDALVQMREAMKVAAANCPVCDGAGETRNGFGEVQSCVWCAPFRAALALTTEETRDE